jgi:hypothetical protein
MKKTFLYLTLTTLLVMTMQAFAGPPPYRGGGAYRSVGHYGYPIAPYGWRGGYWGPRVGVYVGPGFSYWGPWGSGWGLGYGFPYTYAYPYPAGYPLASFPVVINATPITQTYIQKEPIAEATIQPAPSGNYWYYCTEPAGYFPYVQNCSQPWITVTPPSSVTPQ